MRTRDDFVVNIGVVAGVGHVVTFLLQIFSDYIVNQSLVRVSDMGVARYRNSAGVHAHFVSVNGHEVFFLRVSVL